MGGNVFQLYSDPYFFTFFFLRAFATFPFARLAGCATATKPDRGFVEHKQMEFFRFVAILTQQRLAG